MNLTPFLLLPYVRAVLGLLGTPPSFANVKRQFDDFVTKLGGTGLDDIKRQVFDALPPLALTWALGAIARFAAQFLVPGAAAVLGVWKAVGFVVSQASRLTALLDTLGSALMAAATNPTAVATAAKDALEKATGLVLNFIGRQLGIDTLIASVGVLATRVLGWLAGRVEALIKWLLGKLGFGRGGAGGAACSLPMGMGGRPGQGGTRPGGGSCFRHGTPAWTLLGLEPIGVLRAGRRVRTLGPAERERLGWLRVPSTMAREDLRLVRLLLGDGEEGVEIELLRP